MRKITIVGAGQSGLHLGIGLLKQGYQVTIITNRTGEQVAAGKVLSSQCMFGTSLSYEKELGLNLWDDTCPPVEGISFLLNGPDGNPAINWTGKLDRPAQSVDQRVKMPVWMDRFVAEGGDLLIADAGVEMIEDYAAQSDLTIVASGKGEIGRLFERDAARSAYDKPMRALGLTYVNGMPYEEDFNTVAFNLIPGVGEYFVFPALTTTGPCHIMVFEGVPGGEMDCWNHATTPQEHLELSVELVERFAPQQASRCQHLSLTDDNGILAGRFPPTIKHPVATLPSGVKILGVGDTVCLNDPITGQGSNNASKAAKVYLDAILARGDQPFDEAWMQQTFETFWNTAQYIVNWTNALLLPPPEHIQQILGFANNSQETADRISNGFDNAQTLYPWFMEPDGVRDYITGHSA